MSIETYGTGERLRVAASLSVPFGIERRIILLPVPTTRDGVTVTATDIRLSEVISDVGENTYIFGYGIPSEISCAATGDGALVYDLSLDEEYLRENAYLTALGTLGYLLTGSSRQLCGMRIGIIGYGRIGKELLRLFLFLSFLLNDL